MRLRDLSLSVLAWAAACVHSAATPSPTRDLSMRVMTYNIAAGHGDLEKTRAAIAAAQPDLVALQEVDVHWDARSNFVDQAATLGERLGMHVRFAHIYDFPGASTGAPERKYGVALLSKYPIVGFINHPITRLSTQQEGAPPMPMPGFLEARIDVHGTWVRVFDTHTDYRKDPSVRRTQVAEMLAVIGNSSMPTLLLGDLNAPPDASELQPLLARLHDAWPASAGPGLTYPSDHPVKRIDYVLTSSHFRVRSARVPVTEASDHRPVVVDLIASGIR
ncbi:MAG TPA: endonuclease/exonuclease/phosphatase family protein [Vicinamibacterales bacterium]